jgi:hypothetical protein
MGLARNLSKFKPNSDGLVGAEDIADGAVTADKLGFTLSSEALTKSIPLKSGATLSAGRAVNINSSGQVGDYPVVNTLGTLSSSSSGVFENYNGWFSTDGSRAIDFVLGSTLQIKGYAITDTTTTVGTAVNWGASGLSNGGFPASNCCPINETQFLVATHTSNHNDYTSTTSYYTFKVVTVDSSGNITQGTAATFSVGSSGPAFGSDIFISRLPSGRFAIYIYLNLASGNASYHSRTASISDTSITLTSDTDLSWYSDYQSYLTSSNKLIGASGTAVYYCNYDGSTTSSYASASIVTTQRGATDSRPCLLNSNYGIVLYQKGSNDFGIGTFSIDQTTGVPTQTDFKILGNSTFPLYNCQIIALNSTDIAISYKLGALTYMYSLKLNATGNVIGTGIPLVIDSASNDIYTLRSTSTSNVIRYFFNTTVANSRNITINTYNTLSWTGVGAVATSQATSPASVVISGVCGGFSGLSTGSAYYVNESTYDGQITTTAGAYPLGTAISSTEILLG